jgi:hypothetical protein
MKVTCLLHRETKILTKNKRAQAEVHPFPIFLLPLPYIYAYTTRVCCYLDKRSIREIAIEASCSVFMCRKNERF